MGNLRWASAAVVLVVLFSGRLPAQEVAPWHDPSPHNIRFVTVEENVKLEVLDWGGTGRPLVLLAGLGNTAHVFDEFAPKLIPDYHVYGITRRGCGASSAPDSGYSPDRLGDDVVEVLDTLKLDAPVLVGHSIAGEEMSSVATRHSKRVAGLIYLDAAYPYAYYDSARGDFSLDLLDLQRKLEQLKKPVDVTAQRQLVEELLQDNLPGFQRDLQEMQKKLMAPPTERVLRPAPTPDDFATYTAYRSYVARIRGVIMPEAELRQNREPNPDGSVGRPRRSPADLAIIANQQKYSDLRVPILAIYAVPHDLGLFDNDNPRVRAAAVASDAAITEAQAKAFENGVLSSRVVRLRNANHYVFLSNEDDVLREMRAFLAGLH